MFIRRARPICGDVFEASVVALFLLLFTRMTANAQQPAAPSRAQSSPASAASPSVSASAAAPAAASESIEEIVVTAQKREQLSKDVPIALTAISAANLEFRGIANMSDLEEQVPGLQYGFDSGNEQQIYIRGVGVDDSSASLEAPIATYVNGVYQTRTFREDSLGLDLERVEVLKGPQGTLFGRNATGGLINIVLKQPSDELTGALKVGGGSYGQLLSEGRASGPLIK